jgi:GNAT superfamily N-acetyltransferase
MSDPDVRVRRARLDDHDAVRAFTENTWSDEGRGDYIHRVFPDWVEADGPRQRTLVAETGGNLVGIVQVVVLSEYEAWLQGARVHPDHRGRGITVALNEACFEWARDRGAAVGRLMVFSWNEAGLAAARANGFAPVTEFRWAHPEPAPDATGADGPPTVGEAPEDAHARWTASDARAHLGGLGLDLGESWACSAVDRETWREAERVLAVGSPVRAATYRVRTDEREDDDGTTVTRAEYGVGAWADVDACRELVAAVARDAAAVGADRTRVLIPETARHVSDVARVGAPVADEPDFVLAADLTGR